MMCRISGFFEIRWLAAEIFSHFLLCSFDVRRDLLRVLFVIIGKNIGVGHTNRLNPVYARHLLLICEIGIAEFLKPGKVVEHGMINAIRPGGTYVSVWHAQVLKNAGAFARSDACCSPHSVEPISPSSSASQLPKTIVRFGFHPDFNSSPMPCAASSMAAVPLLGSTAPYTQASR